jgi:hypothetical protein
MALNRTRAQKYLDKFDFESLFIEELGWDTVDRVILPLEVDGEPFEVAAIAQKRGFTVYQCVTTELPARSVRVKLDRELDSKSHLLVFGDEAQREQVWMWVRREPGKPLAPRFAQYQVGQSAERLLQKLDALAIDFAEEDSLTLVDVATRAKKAFDVEKVTKAFFTRFEKEHDQFLKFIDGIQSEFDRTWYASLMLNRLMFVYFIQKKGFLDGDPEYLKNRLKRCKAELGDGEFYSFYRQFLLKLFHEGLGKPGRDQPLQALIGQVPYLNGGLFEVHQLEEKYDAIQVPDEAFEKVFKFFDEFDWHLDDRPLSKQNEINPDVLGYIFEKYINQKQMGAYYTKEDITEYISKNTIIPFLFDAAQKGCKVAFKPEGAVWALLRENPDRYLYDAVKKGIDQALPAEIAAGIADVAQRGGWNKAAAVDVALPTETWREHVARRSRALDLRVKLAAGEVTSINDLITYNLDIRQFAQDVIAGSESSDLLKAFYQAIEQVSVLDPTCGSGAFLFAALNILEPMYTACLERMQGFVDEDDLRLRQEDGAKPRFEYFRKVLRDMEQHVNQRYFVLKSIMLNNLYGVDIMEEATEICKLRLFLKLVAQVERQPKKENFGLEPLPDIDFNIRAGNTLVGFASLDEVRKAIRGQDKRGKNRAGNTFDDEQFTFDLGDAASVIEDKAMKVDLAYRQFKRQQTELGGQITQQDKRKLRSELESLNNELNLYLAKEYGVDAQKESALTQWRDSHQPFHWFVEFYSIINRGGFDVIVGNPPWKEYAAVKKSQYKLLNFRSEKCGNLYAMCTERILELSAEAGWSSFIVQLPLVSSSRMVTLREMLRQHCKYLLTIPFDDRPGKLFKDLEHCRSSIFIAQSQKSSYPLRLFTSRYQRWASQARDYLFPQMEYAEILGQQIHANQFPKYANRLQESLFSKITKSSTETVGSLTAQQSSENFIFYQEATQYWVKATTRLPHYAKNGVSGAPAHGRFLYFKSEAIASIASSILNSSLFYSYFIAYGDCFHLSDKLASGFPVTEEISSDQRLVNLNQRLMKDLKLNAESKMIKTKDGDSIEYDEFSASKSNPIIDEIDRVLAQHYGFTDEELDFIINYDIKYRMGRANGGDE